MRRVGAQHQVPLLRARRHAGRRTGPLHVEDDGRHFGVVREADELGHQRDPGTRRRRERARAGPRRADHHADGRQLVFRLEDREPVLLGLRLDAVFLAEAFERFHQRGRRRDRIPRADGRARIQAAERGGGVAVDQDRVLRLVRSARGGSAAGSRTAPWRSRTRCRSPSGSSPSAPASSRTSP